MSLYCHNSPEDKRLLSQNKILAKFTKNALNQIVAPTSNILDVGCASGDYIMMQLENTKYAKLVGIDIDENQIDQANTKYKADNAEFICADIMNYSFSESFDIIILSSVLLHMDKPVELLKKLNSILNQDGYIFIQEEDDGANINYPISEFYDLAYKIWEDSKESGDRHCARKVPGYLNESGFKDVQLLKEGITNIGLSESEMQDFWDIYFNHELWETKDIIDMFEHKETYPLVERYIQQYAKNKHIYDAGQTFISLGFFLFTARK